MLYFQVLFYIGSRLLLSYHYLQLIPDICRTGLGLGTSSQFVIILVYNFSSTLDNIFIVRQIFLKSHEHNIDLYNIFVDYIHAFDSVHRNKLTECLKQFEAPYKLITLIGLTLIHTKARVKVNKDFTEEFIVKCGVKQGDPLSATLFNLFIDTILKQMELRGNITTCLKQCIAYADDILLTTIIKQSLLDTFQKLKEISAQYGLIVNGQKTKYQLETPMSQIYFILE